MRMLRDRPGAALRLLAVLPLASGAALLVHVLAGISLGVALLAALAIVAARPASCCGPSSHPRRASSCGGARGSAP
jgi:hypothetical protein